MHIFQRIGRSPVFVRGVQPFSSLSPPEWRRSRDFARILKVPVCKVPVCELLRFRPDFDLISDLIRT